MKMLVRAVLVGMMVVVVLLNVYALIRNIMTPVTLILSSIVVALALVGLHLERQATSDKG